MSPHKSEKNVLIKKIELETWKEIEPLKSIY